MKELYNNKTLWKRNNFAVGVVAAVATAVFVVAQVLEHAT